MLVTIAAPVLNYVGFSIMTKKITTKTKQISVSCVTKLIASIQK